MLPHWSTRRQRRLRPLVEALLRENIHLVDLQLLAERTNLSSNAVRMLAARLVRHGLGERIGPGLYQLGPPTPQELLGAQIRLHAGWKRSLAYRSALEVLGVIQPLPEQTVYLKSWSAKPSRELPGLTVHFIRRTEGYPFRQQTMDVPGLGRLSVTDLETTLIDAVHRPSLCGDILSAAWLIARHRKALKVDVLVTDALTVAPADRSRLGLLLELAGLLSDEQREALRQNLPKSMPVLDLTRPVAGPRVGYWGLRLNVPFEELQSAVNLR